MKVAHLITGLETGGAEMMLYKLVSRMDRRKFDGIVISLMGRGRMAEQVETAGTRIVTLGMRRGIPNPIAVLRLVQLLRAERPAVLLTWLYHSDLAGLIAGRLAGVPSIIWNLRARRCARRITPDHCSSCSASSHACRALRRQWW